MTIDLYDPHALMDDLWSQLVKLDGMMNPRIEVMRGDDIVAVSFDVEPKLAGILIPMCMTAYRADQVVFSSDTWLWKGHELPPRAPRFMFEEGHPQASEGLIQHAYHRDGVHSKLQLPYERIGGAFVRGEVIDVSRKQHGGNTIPAGDSMSPDVLAKARTGAEAVIAAEGGPTTLYDLVATKVISEATGTTFMLSLGFDTEEERDVAMVGIQAIAQELGYDINLDRID